MAGSISPDARGSASPLEHTLQIQIVIAGARGIVIACSRMVN
jgi:hypothetical protein